MKINLWQLTIDGEDQADSAVFATEEELENYLRETGPDDEDMDLSELGEAMCAKWDQITIEVPVSIEILHTRDPDSSCGIGVWVNGEETRDFYEDSLDPGAGYDDDSWEYNIQEARDANTSPAFKAAVLQAYEDFGPIQKKWSL
jgi:hypothetical protein